MEEDKKPNPKRKIWKIVLASILVVVVAIGASVAGVTWHYLNQIQRPDSTTSYMDEEEYTSRVQQEEGTPDENLSEIAPDNVIWSDGNPLGLTGNVTNIC